MQLQSQVQTKANKASSAGAEFLQRACACGQHSGNGGECAACRQRRMSLQRQAASPAAPDVAPPIVHEVLRSSGQPLDASTRAHMEPRFGRDFSRVPATAPQRAGEMTVGPPNDRFEQEAEQAASAALGAPPVSGGMRDFSPVRVHTDARAAESARAVGARAYTVGQNIVFGAGQYAPGSGAGQRLLAHELAHTVQQNGAKSVVQRYSTQDCDPADVTRIDESHNRAIELLETAIRRLTADPVTADTQRHFANHFGGYGTLRRDIVVMHFNRDLNLLKASEMTYECESECDQGEPAYTYWIFGDIHICLPWLRSQVLNERAETFVHELHHWDAGRGHLDLGYHKNNQDSGTTWVVAVNNADAYSELAQDLFEQP
jgi:hypothetical protein